MGQAGLSSSRLGGLESRSWTVAEAHFGIWWRKALEVTMARTGLGSRMAYQSGPSPGKDRVFPASPLLWCCGAPHSGGFPSVPSWQGQCLGRMAVGLQGYFPARAVGGEPPHFAKKAGVPLKSVSIFEFLYRKGWLLASST